MKLLVEKFRSFYVVVLDTYHRYKSINTTAVLIYTMGKVGSSDISKKLKLSFQFHNFDQEIPAKNFSSRFTPHIYRYVVEALRWKILGRKLLRVFGLPAAELKVISIVRDPVARNLSAFFQNLDESQVIGGSVSESEFYAYTNHMLPLVWFDVEFKRHLGVDVYAYPFDVEAGWCVIEKEGFKILILQLEELSNLGEIVADFVGDDKVYLGGAKQNFSGDKWYGVLYSDLKAKIDISDEYLNLMYKSRFMKHFYGDEKTARMRAKWTQRDSSES
ncbi:putative capsular polysaccharide synthesis family protein [Spongiibacter tropicus]|uniref:putative capsular polysaccharide synthesis family protein n=1 Tax=Spongiibacter tropicus TaxID=454602 RepID=UPI00300944E0